MVRTISTGTLTAEHTGAPTTGEKLSLCEELKRLGFIRENQIMLYGHKFEVVNDPIVLGHNLVVVDAIEKNSGLLMRVRIPLTILKIAKGNRRWDRSRANTLSA